jgi:hypothetical protein
MSDSTEVLAIQSEIDKLIEQTKNSLEEVRSVAVGQAWKILQLAVATTIQVIETKTIELSGPDKKTLAMDIISNFYNKVFVIVDIPFVPNLLEPVMHKYIKGFLMVLVGASIDAMVSTFRQIGVFKSKSIVSQSIKPKVKKIRKKK